MTTVVEPPREPPAAYRVEDMWLSIVRMGIHDAFHRRISFDDLHALILRWVELAEQQDRRS